MKRYLLVGLPSTGKTTFLAALWHVVESDEVKGSLRLERLEGDREYLNRIRDQWLTYKEVERTPGGAGETISMTLVRPDTGDSIELSIPDLAGETFREQWISRRWDNTFVQASVGASGILLFIHPNRVTEPTTIMDVARSVAAIDGDDEESASEEEHLTVPWQAEKAPTQVQIVELLQFASQQLGNGRPIRLAVIVSAWDIVVKQGELFTPDTWVGSRLPLLSQFLHANAETIESRIFGVSAQGGDLITDRAELLGHEVSASRIVVRQNDTESSDITKPLAWLLDEIAG